MSSKKLRFKDDRHVLCQRTEIILVDELFVMLR